MRTASLTAILICLAGLPAQAQGLVNFFNDSSTQVSTIAWQDGAWQLTALPAGTYYFGLLNSTSDGFVVSFTGLYATNQATPGLFNGGVDVPVPGWVAGSQHYYRIAGWSENLGHDWQPGWSTGGPNPLSFPTGTFFYYGESEIGSTVAGGPAPPAPQANLSAVLIRGSIYLFWAPVGGTLQSSPSLGADANWTTVGTANPSRFDTSGDRKFFRVVQPDPRPPPTTPNLMGPNGVKGFVLDWHEVI